MNIAEEWIRDMPQQFQGRPKIEALFKALGKQLDELNQALWNIRDKTSLDIATGKNLDYIGDNIILSRKEANIILRKALTAEMTDDNYRQVLQYKSIQNSCNCTCYDIMGTIDLLWDTSNITYYENPERPATIRLILPDVSIDKFDPSIGRVLAIKSSGVQITYDISYFFSVKISGLEKVNVSKVKMLMPLPFWRMRLLNGEWFLDGSYLLDGMWFQDGGLYEIPTKIKIATTDLPVNEDIVGSVIINWGAWCLNGKFYLDGSKKFNSSQSIKEEL